MLYFCPFNDHNSTNNFGYFFFLRAKCTMICLPPVQTSPLKVIQSYTDTAYLSTSLRFIHIVSFHKLKVCGNLASSKSISTIFPNAFAAHFVSYFGNPHKISEFFIIITFVIVICDQWSLVLLLQKDYDSLKVPIMVSIFKQ